MTEDQIDEELGAIEYAHQHINLVINELEDIDYWRDELYGLNEFLDKLEARQAEVEEAQNELWKRESEGD